jgi:hypothetical protein
MSHPLNELLVKDGQIYRKVGISIEPYMTDPEIKAVDLKGPVRVSEREFRLTATLNHAPDVFWENIFMKVLEIPSVEIVSHVLTITTIPVNIENRWEAVKKAMDVANLRHADIRKKLIMAIQENDKQRAVEEKGIQQAQEEAKRLFDKLQL